MRKTAITLIITVLVGGAALVFAQQSHAQKFLEGLTETGSQAFEAGSYRLPGLSDQEYSPTAPRSPITILALLVNIALGFIGIVMVGLIIYAGFQYMFATSPDAAKHAQKTIVNAGIGLLIVLASFSISYFVLKQIEFAVQGPRQVETGGTQGQTIELPQEVNLEGGL